MHKFRFSNLQDFFFFCDFDPGPSLGVYREGHPTPWSQLSLLHSDKKVTGHSIDTYLQHCIWYLINFFILLRSVPIFCVSLSVIYYFCIIFAILRSTMDFFLNICKIFSLLAVFLQYFKYLEGLIG